MTRAVFSLREIVFNEQVRRHQREKSKSLDQSEIFDADSERSLLDKVAQLLLQRFKTYETSGQPWEVEACFWVLKFGGTVQSEIGIELLRTVGGLLTLIRGTILQMGIGDSREDLRAVPQLIAPMVEFEVLHRKVLDKQSELQKLDEGAVDWLIILDRIAKIQTAAHSSNAE